MFYTYHLYHVPTRKHYYGVRYSKNAKISDLWNTYFTSSKLVHNLIEEYGKESFVPTIRKIFESPEEAVNWESAFLKKVNAKHNQNWINQHNGDGKFLTIGKCSEYRRKRISESKKGKPSNRKNYRHSKITKNKISESNKGKNLGPLSNEHKDKISKAMKKNLAELTPEEQSERVKNSMSSPQSWTEERKQKISNALTGKVVSEESRQKMSKSKLAIMTPERCLACGDANRGKTWKVIDGKRVWMEKNE